MDAAIEMSREACDAKDKRIAELEAMLAAPAQRPLPVLVREALEKISGQREYHSKDHQMATKYKPEEGLWTTDEYLADAALCSVTSTDRTKP